MSFCMAGAALGDILSCVCKRVESHFVAGAILLRRFQKMSCIFCGRLSTLETSIVILRGKRSIRFRSVVRNDILRGKSTIPDTPHTSLYTLHISTLYILNFTLYTLLSTLHTPHSKLHTLHSTLRTLHFTLHTPHSTLYTPHSTLYTFTAHTLQCTL